LKRAGLIELGAVVSRHARRAKRPPWWRDRRPGKWRTRSAELVIARRRAERRASASLTNAQSD
jgi:hypothetical protein